MSSAQQQRPGLTQQTPNFGREAAQCEQLRPQPKENLPEDAKTIGDALETACHECGDKPLEMKDARAIQSAEARATGAPAGVLGGPSAYCGTLMGNPDANPTLGDALEDVKEYLPMDKVVTQRDAERITQAESRNDPMGRIDPHGIAACVQDAAKFNIEHGHVPQDTASAGNVPRGAAGRGQPMGQ